MGWGALPQVFDEAREEWEELRNLLRKELTDAEWDAARATTLNAHYTAPDVVRAMYRAIERFGFQGGRVLEPACGTGHFVGVMPDALRAKSRITGIELDPVTAGIAKALYPEADIRAQGFEKASLADDFFDLAVSNVPFGDYEVHDPRFKGYHFHVHDYFFAAALRKVRPGGLVAFITSRGTMDKKNSTLRALLGPYTELLGAIRLPNTAFRENAGTSVTTDIIMLRKLELGESPPGPSWLQARPHSCGSPSEPVLVNEYYLARPAMMLGRMTQKGSMYRREEGTLDPIPGEPLSEGLGRVLELLPRDRYRPPVREQRLRAVEAPAPASVKPHSYCLHEDALHLCDESGQLVAHSGLGEERTARIRGLIGVRTAARECLAAQLSSDDESAVGRARQHLNVVYDSFVKRFGPLNGRSNRVAFDGDPDLPLLMSLEIYDPDKKTAAKTAIFRERTIHRREAVSQASEPREALLFSLNEFGRVDLGYMARLLRRDEEGTAEDLKGLIFLNPQTEEWETDDQYLSGDVRAKLTVAKAASLADKRFEDNVEALAKVQLEDVPASEINARLGSPWIPAEDVAAFAKELLGVSSGIRVHHISGLATWRLDVNDVWIKTSPENRSTWGTEKYPALDLIEDVLNLRTPTVYASTADGGRVINPTETEAAREKAEKLREAFKSWLWKDDTRRERLTRLYNDTFNGIRPRTFSGEHLRLPGASRAITLAPHQKAGAWRILQDPNVLLAHVVGAGKTYTMVAAGMELKRLGLAKKPMFAVPNHMLGSFAKELLSLYPGANILVADKKSFQAQQRRRLFGRVATGNWDAVIVTHSGFERIPVSDELKRRLFKAQIDEMELVLRRHADEAGAGSRVVKQLEKAKKRLEAKLEGLSGSAKKDDLLTFEELGVDRLFVDEAHLFKNLFFPTKMQRIAGLPQSNSERAFDMLLKVRYVQSLNAGGGVVFATGTPISNTMAEMYVMQLFLQPELLRERGLEHFDSWAANFGEPVTALELSPDGAGYRLQTRFARFVNVPELMAMFRNTADIQTAEMLNLQRPRLENDKAEICLSPATPEVKAFVQSLAQRAERLKTGRVDPREDNMLKVTSEGRKFALDPRLIDPAALDAETSKVNKAVENIHRIWKETAPKRSAQLVFCDLSTPKDEGFSVYRDMAKKLKERGIPEAEIAFIHDFQSDAAKLELFAAVRSGSTRILFGSTQMMGAGTNVQTRLYALHDLDAPWRPSDIEQRHGRILRQGNQNERVRIFRYVTEGSFDAYMWQTLEAKARFIEQVMSGKVTARRMEDPDAPALTYAEVKAIASGNPLVIEKAKVDAELLRLGRLESAHAEEQFRARSDLRRAEENVQWMTASIAARREDLSIRENTSGEMFRIVLGGQEWRHRQTSGEWINKHAAALRNTMGDEIPIGRFAGFELVMEPPGANAALTQVQICGRKRYAASVCETGLGTVRSLEMTVGKIEELIAQDERALAEYRRRVVELRDKGYAPFEYEERVRELRKRQDEIVDALDLAKNQAPAVCGADGEEQEREEGPEVRPEVAGPLSTREGEERAACAAGEVER